MERAILFMRQSSCSKPGKNGPAAVAGFLLGRVCLNRCSGNIEDKRKSNNARMQWFLYVMITIKRQKIDF